MRLVDDLVAEYDRFVSLPWRDNLAGPERQWMLIYPPDEERRIRFRLPEFEGITKKAGHHWTLLDLTDVFGRWLGSQDYAEEYYRDPEYLSSAIDGFVDYVVALVEEVLQSIEVDEDTVVAILGVGSLYPFARVSNLLQRVSPSVPGRMLVFFPGEKEGNTYRLLNAKDGWNYLATPITVSRE
jgi:hypothetical protein